MGNTCHCCIFQPRRTNQVFPTDCNLSEDDKENSGVISQCNKQSGKYIELTAFSTAKNDSSDLERSSKKGSKTEDKRRAKLKEDDMKQWINNIILQNTLHPSSSMFNNKRHLAMRASFSGVIQKMTYSSTILESKEDLKASKDVDVSLHTDLKTWPFSTFDHHIKSSVESSRDRRYNVRQLYTRWKKNEKHSSGTGSVAVFYKETEEPCKRNLEKYPHTMQDDSTVQRLPPNDQERETLSFNSDKPSQIYSNWVDEDFKEAILTNPVTEPCD